MADIDEILADAIRTTWLQMNGPESGLPNQYRNGNRAADPRGSRTRRRHNNAVTPIAGCRSLKRDPRKSACPHRLTASIDTAEFCAICFERRWSEQGYELTYNRNINVISAQ
jgi:hypothetical protein